MGRKKVIEIKDIIVNQNSLRDFASLSHVSIKVYKGQVVSIICSEKEAKSIVLSVLGKVVRWRGKVLINESNVPNFPISITKNLRYIINSKTKYIDMGVTSVFLPNQKIRTALKNILKHQDNSTQKKKYNIARLDKLVLLEVGRFIEDDYLQEQIIEKSDLLEKQYYAAKSIKHYNQILKETLFMPITFLMSGLIFFKEYKNTMQDLKRLRNKDSEVAKTLEYNSEKTKNVKLWNEDYLGNRSPIKNLRKQIKKKITKLRVQKVRNVFTKKELNLKLKSYVKARAKRKVKFKTPYQFVNKIEPHDEDSLYQSMKLWFINTLWKMIQLNDYFENKKRWKKYSYLFSLNEELKIRLIDIISQHISETTRKNVIRRRSLKVEELAKKVNFNIDLLDVSPENLSRGEQFSLDLLACLMTDPDIVFVKDYEYLDPSLRGQNFELLKKLQESEKFALVYLTSEIETGLMNSSYAYVINKKVVEQGRPEEIFSTPVHPHTRYLVRTIIPNTKWSLPSELEDNKGDYYFSYSKPYQITETHYVNENEDVAKVWLSEVNEIEMNNINSQIIYKTLVFKLN